MMKLYQRIYNDNDHSELVNVGYDKIDFKKKTVLCFPGQWAIGDEVKKEEDIYSRELFGKSTNSYNKAEVEKHISGFMRIAERMLGAAAVIKEKNVRLICATYRDTVDNDITSSAMMQYNYEVSLHKECKSDPNFFSNEAAENAFHAILPLISKNNKITFTQKGDKSVFSVKGEPLPMEEICENLKQVKLLSYSFGTVHAAMVNNALKKFMDDLGFDNKQIRTALGNVDLLSLAGPIVSRGNDTLYFRTVTIEGKNDGVISDYVPKYVDSVSTKKQTPYIEKVSDNFLRIIITNPSEIEYIKYNSKTGFSQPPETDKVSDPERHHRLRFYTSYRTKEDGNIGDVRHSIMIENCLNNMISNKPTEDITDLLRYAETMVNPNSNRFRALRKMFDPFIDKLINSTEDIRQK